MVLVLLTLKKHRDGIWLTNLVQALRDVGQEIQVTTIEDFFVATPSVGTLFENLTGVVNRVSDAADPIAFKMTVSILTAASKRGIPVFNGPESYSLCANKFCHHLVFEMAGVQAPPSHIIASSDMGDVKNCIERAEELQFPILMKPNAGGFGSGIHRLDNEAGLHLVTKEQLATSDGVRLVQSYVHPSDDYIYRIWFLNGQVQCGVKRKVENTQEYLTSGCVGGSSCQRPRVMPSSLSIQSFSAFTVPSGIREDVERILAQLPDAHAGSIEYLYSDKTMCPLFFDLNLLSTLPLVETIHNAHATWGPTYDPWAELALCILHVCKRDEDPYT